MRLSLSIIIFLGYLIKPQTGFEIAKMIDEKPVPRSLSNKIEMVQEIKVKWPDRTYLYQVPEAAEDTWISLKSLAIQNYLEK